MDTLLASEEKGLHESGMSFWFFSMACQIFLFWVFREVCECTCIFSIRNIVCQGVSQFIFALSEVVPAWFLVLNIHLLTCIWGFLVIAVEEAANWFYFAFSVPVMIFSWLSVDAFLDQES